MGQQIGKLKELRVPLIIFLTFWAIAIGFNSSAGIAVAAFSHAYIWVHFYSTEKPDMIGCSLLMADGEVFTIKTLKEYMALQLTYVLN